MNFEKTSKAERRAREATFPKCACGNTLGLAAVEAATDKCKRCVDVAKRAKESLHGCRTCGASGTVPEDFDKNSFGGDIDITCLACGSSNTGLAAHVIADPVADNKRLVQEKPL